MHVETKEGGIMIKGLVKAAEKYSQRIMIAVPMTGVLRAEWMLGRYGQVIPCNWSQIDYIMWIDQFTPMGFMVADARNLAVREFRQKNAEWLVFIDHDTIVPPNFYMAINERIIHEKVPVWSGLYFTRSVPAEPLVYRELGHGYYADWRMGDQVWTKFVPMGCTIIHASILDAMWDEAEEYQLGPMGTVRRVFDSPRKAWIDPETMSWNTRTGTEDLDWCKKIVENDIFKKAGWPEYQKKKYPFLVDTNIFCQHIEIDGTMYPSRGEDQRYRIKP
jgi:hypothetical protein